MDSGHDMAFVIIIPPVIGGLDPHGSLALSQRCRERNQFSHGSLRLMAFTAWMLSQQNAMGNTVANSYKPDKHFPQDNFLLGKSNKQHQIDTLLLLLPDRSVFPSC